MISQIAITKIGRNSDGDCSFGFAYNEEGVSTYIPSTIVKLMGWDESHEGQHFTVSLGPNGNDANGTTPYIVNSMAPKIKFNDSFRDPSANSPTKPPLGSVHKPFAQPQPEPEPAPAYTVEYEGNDEFNVIYLQNEIIYHKLRGICPWGSGTNEGVRRAVAPYADSGEYCSIVDVQDELVQMGLSEASATPAISLLTKAGFITRDGTKITVTDAGVDAIDQAIAEFDDSPRELLRQEAIANDG